MMKSKRVIGLGLLGVSTAILLSGCSVLPLPDEERYYFINEVKNNIHYSDVGDVLIERYDTGDGSFSPSFFYAEIEGIDTYDNLQENLLEFIPREDCSTFSELQTTCDVGVVDILLRRESAEDLSTTLKITDVFGGRDPQ